MTRTAIPQPLYQYLITESRGLCNLCHRTMIDEIHHIIPVERGGTNDYENLIGLCGSCHAKLHKTAYRPLDLAAAKDKWLQDCRNVIARVVSSAASESERIRHMLDSFDAVQNIQEFDGFHARLTYLLGRRAIFENLFRVHDHHISIAVDMAGNAMVTEMQRWSSFVPFKRRAYHIEGSTPCPTDEVAFKIAARSGKQALGIRVEVTEDHPTYKSFTIHFRDQIAAFQPVVINSSYSWPNVWDISRDRYTYDVFGWAERLQYSMVFPASVHIDSVHDSYIDMFGSEWKSIGTSKVHDHNGFDWIGNRLPLFSTVVINYANKNAV